MRELPDENLLVLRIRALELIRAGITEPYRNLAQAVLEQAVKEATAVIPHNAQSTLKIRMEEKRLEARRWLSGRSQMLKFWCNLAGTSPEAVRRIIGKGLSR